MFRRLLLALALLLVPATVLAQGQRLHQDNVLGCMVEQQNINRTLDGTAQPCRVIRDGALVEIPWTMATSLEGRVFAANFGTGTTSITGKTTFTSGSPEANLDIPAGVTVMPLAASVTLTGAATSINIHVWCQVNGNLTGNGTSSAGPTVFNLRIGDQPFASRVLTRQAYSAAGTAPTNLIELLHVFNAAAPAAATPWEWSYPTLPLSPVVGPASVSCYAVAGTAAPTAMFRLVWIELPSSTVQ